MTCKCPAHQGNNMHLNKHIKSKKISEKNIDFLSSILNIRKNEELIICSFDKTILNILNNNISNIYTCTMSSLCWPPVNIPYYTFEGISRFLGLFGGPVKAVTTPLFATHCQSYDYTLKNILDKKNIKFIAGSVENKTDYKRMKELNVFGVFTDNIEKII